MGQGLLDRSKAELAQRAFSPRSLLLAALCLRFRSERTYPCALGPFYHSQFTGGWQNWGDVAWEWSRVEGQTPDSLRALLPQCMSRIPRVPGSGEVFVLQYPGPGSVASEASAVPVLQAGNTEFLLEPRPTEGADKPSG